MRKLAVLLALCFPAAASADDQWNWTTHSYTDQHPAPQALTALAQGQAETFWHVRGVNTCPSITVYQSTAVGAIGAAGGGWCTIWLSDDLVASAEPGDVDKVDGTVFVDVCQAITHEVGHALGLPHSATGVMAGGGTGQPAKPHGWAPWFCWRWADQQMTALLIAEGWPRKLAGRFHLPPAWSPG